MSQRFHINLESGNPGVCRAKYKCRFGDIEKDHFDSRESAQEHYEKKMERTSIDPKTTLKKFEVLADKIAGENRVFSFVIKKLVNHKSSWTEREKEDLAILLETQKLLANPTQEKLAKAYKLKKEMNGIDRRAHLFLSNDARFQQKDLIISNLAEDTILRAEGRLYQRIENPPKREKNDRVLGLEDAQRNAVKEFNSLGMSIYNEPFLTDNAEDLLDSTLDRIAAGEVYTLPSNYEDRRTTGFAEKEDKLITVISDPENNDFSQSLYLSTVFPDKELKEAFDKQDIQGVSTTFVPNGREDGLAYTTMQPDGSTRTFMIHEHRNTDSIIINGTTNWKPGELPRTGDSSNTFFAEFRSEDKKQAADTLAFFIKSAQKGDIDSDRKLADKAEHLDWTSILEDRIPGFKDWAQKNGIGVDTTADEKKYGHRFPKM